jgi:hypothetical protein
MDKTDKNCPPQVDAIAPRHPIPLAIQDRLSEHLRAMYDGLRSEPLPDRLLDLLQQLDQSRSDGGS